MANYIRKTFTDETVSVDGNVVERCRFTRCVLRFSASSTPGGLFSNVFDDCTWVLSGPAAQTLSFLAALCHIGFRDDVGKLCDAVLAGEPVQTEGAVKFDA